MFWIRLAELIYLDIKPSWIHSPYMYPTNINFITFQFKVEMQHKSIYSKFYRYQFYLED